MVVCQGLRCPDSRAWGSDGPTPTSPSVSTGPVPAPEADQAHGQSDRPQQHGGVAQGKDDGLRGAHALGGGPSRRLLEQRYWEQGRYAENDDVEQRVPQCAHHEGDPGVNAPAAQDRHPPRHFFAPSAAQSEAEQS